MSDGYIDASRQVFALAIFAQCTLLWNSVLHPGKHILQSIRYSCEFAHTHNSGVILFYAGVRKRRPAASACKAQSAIFWSILLRLSFALIHLQCLHVLSVGGEVLVAQTSITAGSQHCIAVTWAETVPPATFNYNSMRQH